MKKLFAIGIFLLATTLLWAKEEEVTLKTSTGNLYGTLSVPDQQQPVPVVLLIAGSGPTDRDGNNPMMKNNSLKMLAELLEQNGIAALRYDKRGIAASEAAGVHEADLRFEDYINDAKAWVSLLKKDKRFNKVIIAGHSEGSLIGIATAIHNPEVAKFISLSGPGESMDKVLRKQLEAQPQPIKDMCLPIIDRLVQGDTVGDVHPFLNSLFRPSVQPYLISSFKHDPAKEITKLKIPVLILQGDYDIQCSPEDAELLAKAYPKAQKQIISGMTHILKDCDTKDRVQQITTVYTKPEIPLNKSLGESIVKFIKE